MVSMKICVVSLVERHGCFIACAHATARNARIMLEVIFEAHPEASKSELWDRPRYFVDLFLSTELGGVSNKAKWGCGHDNR